MTTTASQAVIDALDRYKTQHPNAKPSRVVLGPYAYETLHAEARAAGIHCPQCPETEDERLEYRGMKVFCHSANAIEFE